MDSAQTTNHSTSGVVSSVPAADQSNGTFNGDQRCCRRTRGNRPPRGTTPTRRAKSRTNALATRASRCNEACSVAKELHLKRNLRLVLPLAWHAAGPHASILSVSEPEPLTLIRPQLSQQLLVNTVRLSGGRRRRQSGRSWIARLPNTHSFQPVPAVARVVKSPVNLKGG